MWGKWDLGSDSEQPGEGATVKARLAQPLITAAAPGGRVGRQVI